MAALLWALVRLSVLLQRCNAGVATVVDANPLPVIGAELAHEFGVWGGFETGNAIKVNGSYHLFYGERALNTTYPYKMGWTTRIGHWASDSARSGWRRVETVDERRSLWSVMPVFDESADRWKLFYVNEESGARAGVLVAQTAGYGALAGAAGWAPDNSTQGDLYPSGATYSVSNPFRAGPDKAWTVFVDIGGYRVGLANRSAPGGPAGPYAPMGGVDTTLIDTMRVPHAKNGSWIENPVVTALDGGSGGYVALFDWVNGGGFPHGTPVPYIGLSYSCDGLWWPKEHGELIHVVGADPFWTDLVRTPTAAIPEPDGTLTVFYAARDTRYTSPPYLNCSVPRGCFWGIGSIRVKLQLPCGGATSS